MFLFAFLRTITKTNVPESYKSNSKKEQLIISYAENFRRQFKQLYGDRKALFLTPSNEYDAEVRFYFRPISCPILPDQSPNIIFHYTRISSMCMKI